MYGFPVYIRGGNRAGMSAAQKAVRLVAAMALKDVSDGYNLGQVCMMNCTDILIFVDPLYRGVFCICVLWS